MYHRWFADHPQFLQNDFYISGESACCAYILGIYISMHVCYSFFPVHLLKFLSIFLECITGESYAGVYVPNLVKAVVEGNMAGKQPQINIQVSALYLCH